MARWPGKAEQASVRLIPDGVWWAATFRADPARVEIYCDSGTPPRWPSPAEHRVRYRYPANVISNAEAAAAWLLDAISAKAEPFGAAYHRWLEVERVVAERGTGHGQVRAVQSADRGDRAAPAASKAAGASDPRLVVLNRQRC